MARPNIEEVSDDERIKRYTQNFFRRANAQTPAIPPIYAGKYATVMIVVTPMQLSEAQMDDLEAQVEGIAGVQKAMALIGPARIPLGRVPAGSQLRISVDAGFEID